jgi:hypothetical protein
MQVGGCTFRKNKIRISTDEHFEATYKGKQFYISTDHGFGDAEYDHLKRFNIEVTDIKSGMLDADSYQDFHDIKGAIRWALIGCCLLEG